jgi:hypothetical protein
MNVDILYSVRRSFSRRHSSSVSLPLVSLCIGLSCVLLACGDRRESFYPTLADADKDGAITRGWIPYFLPESSRAIHEVGQNSPSKAWCAFEFSREDSAKLRKNLKSIDSLPSSVKRVPSPGASWWPAVLQGTLDVEKIHKAGFEIYVVLKPSTSVTTDVLLFAIDWPKGRGFSYETSNGAQE